MKRLLLVFLLLLIPCLVTDAAERRSGDGPRVLVLHSYHSGLGWTAGITEGIESVLRNRFPTAEIRYEHMDTKRVYHIQYLERLRELFEVKYQKHRFDVIISSDDHALHFLIKHGDALFPDTPVVFCGVNFYRDDMREEMPHITGVVESFDIAGTIDVALSLHPDVRTVFAVTDNTVTGQANSLRLAELIPRYADRVSFTFLDELRLADVPVQLGQLPPDGIVLWLQYTSPADGARLSLEEGCRVIASHSSAPVYSFWDFTLNTGIVGGMLTSGYAHGETAARLAARILDGVPVQEIPVIKESPNRYMFDYRAMERHRISRSRLPADSLVINGPKSFYAVHKQLIWALCAAVVALMAIVFLLVANIHIRRQSESALKVSEERYRDLFNNAQVGLVRAEIESGRILACNRKLALMIGYDSVADCLANCIAGELYVNPADRERIIETVRREGWVEETEVRMVRRDGTRFWASLSSRLDEAEGYLESVVIDISRRKRAEREKGALMERLERSRKMEAMGLLAGGVAHDLNNILSGVVNYPELLLMDPTLADRHRETVEKVRKAGLGAAAIVSDLLTLARSAAGTRQVVNLNTVVREYLASTEAPERGVRLVTDLAPDLKNVAGSPVHFRKALMNLVINATEAVPPDGRVEITTANRRVAESTVADGEVPAGRYAVLTVADNGPGIDPADLEKIFEPFYTKKVMGKSGSGLGLTVVWNTVTDHGGTVRVTSGDRGTQFALFFPVVDEPVTVAPPDLPVDAYRGRGERILVVDDTPHQREIACRTLAGLGYVTDAAPSGEAAVERVKTSDFDLILLDMIMSPGMDGQETFQRIVAIRPDQKVVVASGYAETDAVARIQRRGTGRFVKKPYTRQELGVAVRAELDGG